MDAVSRFWELNSAIINPKEEPSEEWHAAGRIAKRECGKGKAAAADKRPLEERKVLALEAIAVSLEPIANAARLYIVS